jgi:pyridoxamine 5'-phosphate oxidase
MDAVTTADDGRPDLDALADLDPATVAATPGEQFDRWFAEARERQPRWADAMVLATVATDGLPSARAVLLRGVDEEGFRFHTNHDSDKGRALAAVPHAALVFLWWAVERQVRVEGPVEHLPAAESDVYWDRRPRGSQVAAWASPQSRVVAGRDELAAAVAAVEDRFGEGPVPRPPFWGGYLVRPTAVEFWQGRTFRLHDRVRYRRATPDGPWRVERLAP